MNSSPETGVLRKIAWRLLPFLCLLYIFNIRNRGNLGYARGAMNDASICSSFAAR